MNELTHHGIKGQKWGVRRFQNKDGSLTNAGKLRLDKLVIREDSGKNSLFTNGGKRGVDKLTIRENSNPKKGGKIGTDKLVIREDSSSKTGGLLTNAESKKSVTDNSKIRKRVATAAIMGATVAAAAVYVHKHPDAIGKVVSKFKNVKVSDVKKSVSDKGKEYVKQVLSGIKEGAREAAKEAPKKATKAVITGGVMLGTKKILDSVAGKETSAKIFQANDNKKIGKFWKVSPEDLDDKDD